MDTYMIAIIPAAILIAISFISFSIAVSCFFLEKEDAWLIKACVIVMIVSAIIFSLSYASLNAQDKIKEQIKVLTNKE